jgi:hypothetical protein
MTLSCIAYIKEIVKKKKTLKEKISLFPMTSYAKRPFEEMKKEEIHSLELRSNPSIKKFTH